MIKKDENAAEQIVRPNPSDAIAYPFMSEK